MYPEDEVNGAYMTIRKVSISVIVVCVISDMLSSQKLDLPDDFPVDELSTMQDLGSYMAKPEAAHLSGTCAAVYDVFLSMNANIAFGGSAGQCVNMIDGKLITEQ